MTDDPTHLTHVSARRIVRDGYEQVADNYLSSKNPNDPVLLGFLDRLAQSLPPAARVLDLGCGAGVPATRWLAGRYSTVGVDLSARQLALARQLVPDASLILADMAELDFPPGSFDAVVSLHAIIHVPRERQAALVRRIRHWLKPGGAFLGTWAMTAWEGSEDDWEGWAAPMWWSHYGQEENLRLLREAGFTIELAEPRESAGETWLWVLARVGE